MKKKTAASRRLAPRIGRSVSRWFKWILLSLAGVAWSAAETSSDSHAPLPLSTRFWRDPSFVRSFNGSYRINARVEPTITSAERGVLVEVQKLMAAGKRKEAARLLESNKLAKSSPALRFNLGNVLFELGELDKALGEYRAALQSYPSFRRAHRNLAVALVRLDQPAEALPHLLETLRLGGSDSLTWGLLGWCRLQNKDWASALEAYRMARTLDPKSPEWMAGLAECLTKLDRNPEALGLLDEVVRQRPADSAYTLLRVHVLLGLGHATDAAADLDFLRRLGRLDADGLLLLSTLHLRAGREALATSCIDAAFSGRSKPDPERIIEALRGALARRAWTIASKLDAAAQTADPETMPPPARRAITRLRARLAIESGADPSRGESMLRKLLETDPLDAAAAMALARHCAATKRPDEAELLFQRATRTPAYARQAWIEIARLQAARRLYSEALAAIDEAMEIKDTPELRRYRDALARLAEAAE